jgi:hypothetical protein
MSRVLGRSRKITKNQAKGYGYVRNPGVTTIAAINGRGSFAARRSARSVMSKLKKNARVGAARRALTSSEKAAFKARMAKARMNANRSTSRAQSASSRKNIKKAQRARKAWGRSVPRGKRIRVGRAAFGSKPKARRLKAGVYIANKKAGSKTMARRRKRASGLTKKRRSSKRRRKTTTRTSAPKRRRRKAAKKTVKRRRVKRKAAKRTVKRRRTKSRRKAGTKKRRSSKSRRKAGTKKRRSSKSRRKSGSKRRRRSGRKLKANGRRRVRRNGRRRLSANRRRRSHSKNRGHKKNRRSKHRRNGKKLFRMNGAMDFLKLGAVLFGGFAAHRVLSNIVDRQVLSRLLPAPVVAPVSGFDLQSNRGLIASIITGAGVGFLASKVIKNQETKKLVIGGVVASVFQGVIVSLLKSFAPAGADMLAGPEDGTAARLSAMYGLRGGASIMPHYAPIGMRGMGEYFREPMNGMGEYFREPMNGVGEYISATNGLGTYEPNGDLFQAAAGMGAHDYQGNHIDPSGDLDRQLTIAEAAAGVGALSPFEAAAGVMPFEASAGMGAVSTVPGADTWIPGSADPQLWAGVRAVTESQSATEMVPAGTLQTAGGQGIFG